MGNNKYKSKSAESERESERLKVETFLDWLSFSITSKFLKSFHNAFRFFSSHFLAFISFTMFFFRAILPSALNRMCFFFSPVCTYKYIQCILFMDVRFIGKGEKKNQNFFLKRRRRRRRKNAKENDVPGALAT